MFISLKVNLKNIWDTQSSTQSFTVYRSMGLTMIMKQWKEIPIHTMIIILGTATTRQNMITMILMKILID